MQAFSPSFHRVFSLLLHSLHVQSLEENLRPEIAPLYLSACGGGRDLAVDRVVVQLEFVGKGRLRILKMGSKGPSL